MGELEAIKARMDAIRARHWRVGGRGTIYPEQCVCGLAWPCDAAFLLAEVERLRGRRNHWVEGDLVVEQRTLFRQVGWLGRSGQFYMLKDQAEVMGREPAGFAPVYEQIDVDDGEGWHG